MSGIAWACVFAGSVIIVFGAVFGWIEIQLLKDVKEKLTQRPGEQAQPGRQAQPREPQPVDDTDYRKQLTSIARALAGMPQVTQAFLISTLFFAFATGIAIAHELSS